MSGTCLIGVDLGTTATKAAIFSQDGTLLADAAEESRLIQPGPGWVEQDPEDLFGAAVRTIRACLERSGVAPGEIAGLSFDGQMAGIGTVDAHWGTPTPYDSWLDTRCGSYIDAMRPHEEQIVRLTGGPPTYSHGPKILHLAREHPDVFARVAKFVVPGGYVAGRMAGLAGADAFMDYTYLHFTCLADTQAARWSDELCGLFGVSLDKLPRIVRPWEIIGHVTPEAAATTGLLAGTPIAAGCGDQAAGMLGAAMVEPGLVFDVAGTASVLAICTDRFAPDVAHRTLFAARLVPEGLWYSLAYINGGGLNLRWFRDTFAEREAGYRALDEAARGIPPGADGLLFLPHLGGHVCPSDPALRGVWIGFTWAHSKAHFYRSLLESVAYEYALYLDIERALLPGMNLTETRVIGGGSSSDLWNQIKADVLGLPYVRLNRSEFAVLGSAIVAGAAVGVYDDLKATARQMVGQAGRIEPRAGEHSRYRPFVDLYRSLFDLTRPASRALAALQKGVLPGGTR
ncbi:MAG: FGGY family carbohydrate kinase [bacterium]|nr:FGGY family carbohydrate kinase [bacterium]